MKKYFHIPFISIVICMVLSCASSPANHSSNATISAQAAEQAHRDLSPPATPPQQLAPPLITIPELIAQAVEQAFREINKTSRIALVNFATGNVEISEALLGVLEHTLVEQRFIVVDRSELDRIRVEQAFQLDWEVDDNTAVNIGRFVGAEVIVTGSVDALKQLRIRVLNTETAIVVGTSLIPLPAHISIEPSRQAAQRTTQITPRTSQTPATQATEPPQAQTPPTPPPAPAPKVDDIITFGNYEWRVLEVERNRALIITTRIVQNRVFGSDNNWVESNVRRWLNGSFYDSFSAAEKARIVEVSVQHASGTSQDRIFLLNQQEIELYFGSSADRIARNNAGTTGGWWTRTSSSSSGYHRIITEHGSFYEIGSANDAGVRPAMWISF